MKRLRKFSISVMATACLLAFGSGSAFAKTGWADSFETAEVMYSSVNQSSGFSATQYLDSMSDNDYYVVDNTNGSSVVTFSVIATPPPNFDIIMGIIKRMLAVRYCPFKWITGMDQDTLRQLV